MLADKLRAVLGPAKQGGEATDAPRSGRPADVAASEKSSAAGNQGGDAGRGTATRSDRTGHTPGDEGSIGQTGTKNES
jgi:hypothetical protein